MIHINLNNNNSLLCKETNAKPCDEQFSKQQEKTPKYELTRKSQQRDYAFTNRIAGASTNMNKHH